MSTRSHLFINQTWPKGEHGLKNPLTYQLLIWKFVEFVDKQSRFYRVLVFYVLIRGNHESAEAAEHQSEICNNKQSPDATGAEPEMRNGIDSGDCEGNHFLRQGAWRKQLCDTLEITTYNDRDSVIAHYNNRFNWFVLIKRSRTIQASNLQRSARHTSRANTLTDWVTTLLFFHHNT